MTTELKIAGRKLVADFVKMSNLARLHSLKEPDPLLAARLDTEYSIYWNAANHAADAAGVPRPDTAKRR